MKTALCYLAFFLAGITFLLFVDVGVSAQNRPEVLNEKDASAVIPASYYFAGQNAPTQIRNAAAARVGKDRLVIAGMVDTSGYSTEISGKYEGFFITDSPVKIGNRTLATGAYGFGFSTDGRVKIFDISAREILSVATQSDPDLKRPRPLQMIATTSGIRFYKGKNYVLISPR